MKAYLVDYHDVDCYYEIISLDDIHDASYSYGWHDEAEVAWDHAKDLAGEGAVYTTLPKELEEYSRKKFPDVDWHQACWLVQEPTEEETEEAEESTEEDGKMEKRVDDRVEGWEKMAGKVLVTRHKALVKFLEGQGITGLQVIEHAKVDDVRGKVVYGVLPLHLAAEAAAVYTVDLDIPAEKRGQELSLEELGEYFRGLRCYKVVACDPPISWVDVDCALFHGMG